MLKLAVFQSAPRLREPAANVARIADLVSSIQADLVLTPELSVTGYDLGDDATRLAVPVRLGEPLSFGSSSAETTLSAWPGTVVLGLVEQGPDGTPYNAAAVCSRGVVRFVHRKLYLPTYGMFDEGRFFGRGAALDCCDVSGWRVGVLICEDFWHPGLSYVLATAGIDVLLVLAAAPGRGVWEGGGEGGVFASGAVWERIARVTGELYGIYVALANRVGVESAVTFAGGSLVVAPSGVVIARAGELSEQVLEVELSRAEIERARRPYSHARDDNPRLVSAELGRLIAT